jgi:ubiquinone/menaquinone biosynthesis C-methylase UbiE
LPPQGRILDWGCCHAPDSILLRAVFGDAFEFHGCDFVGSVDFGPLRDLAAVQFQPLRDTVRLPYADRFFDVVIGSGTLEHVAMDYESLKELHRILKPGGLFIFTYLPYQRSKVERVNREVHRTFYHNRLYRTAEINQLLRRTGFLPETIEYQERLLRREIQTRVLARHPRRFRRLVSWFKLRFGDRIRGRTSNSSLCGVARKMEMM